MKIVIVGLGTIGKTILKNLSSKKHSVTIIDEDKELIETLIEKYDVQGVVGNGASLDIQKEAGVKGADVFIALTTTDELNVFACMVAKKLGVVNTIARVRNPEYRDQIHEMKEELGISMIVNPEQDTSNEIYNMISLPAIAKIEKFAKGKVLMVEIVVEKGCKLINETLISIGKKINTRVLICAVQRNNDVFIPSGNFEIKEGDRIHLTSDAKELTNFLSEINVVKQPIKNVMIVGGDKVAYYLAQELSKSKYKVKLIEKNKQYAEELAEKLNKVTVVHGNGIQHDFLVEEGIESMDSFVALTNNDEENMVISMFVNKMKVRKIITKIVHEDLLEMLSELGIDNNVSPKDIVANHIISYLRALENTRGSNILTLYRLVNNKVEALEFLAKGKEKIFNKPLRNLKTKDNCLIACIIRDSKVIIPDGNSTIQAGDNVIVVTTHQNFDDLTDIFE